ncbi:MAG: CotH kinase family protein [Bacilli bacterium]|nr:CotH kinase family protein [Bacilli bacterium]
MKSVFKRLSLLSIPFMVASCGIDSPKESAVPQPVSSSIALSSSIASSSQTISSSQLDNYRAVLPEIRFTSDNPEEISFATTAKKDDIDRPTVAGKFSITNAGDNNTSDLVGTMKVRGNQTAGWSKKAFAIKFYSKQNLLGLNGGKKYKKWVLLADAKDTTLIRSAAGLFISKKICADDGQVWVADFTPVSVNLNDQYWGYYYLADQKEVKEGRVNLPEPASKYTGTDIGYCFEMDYYATEEPKKSDGGDPTFSLDYGNLFTRSSYNIENSLANFGPTTTYTMLSDITDGPKDTALNPSNSGQVAFMKNRLQALFNVLGEAVVNKRAKTINEQNEVIDTSMSIEDTIKANFDLDAWADGFIINAFDCPPDVGYSSFYMSFDNTAEGSKKLRFDCPWDFDSNFGNRRDFIVTANTNSGKDPYYMDRTSNMWLQYLGKLDFFMDVVKAKWNKLRNENAFEQMFHLMRTYFADYDGEIQQNHKRWPVNDAAENNTFDEIRDPYKYVRDYKAAETETISWCEKRVNYLEKKWAPEKNRPNVDTNA